MTNRIVHKGLIFRLRTGTTPSRATIIDAKPRTFVKPFVQATAILRKAIRLSQDRLVVVDNYEELSEQLGHLDRMVQSVVLKHGGLWLPMGPIILDHLEWLQKNQYPPALDPNVINVVGHAGLAKILLIGEQINPIFKRFRHWPFYAHTGCAPFLISCLRQAGLHPRDYMMTNIQGQESHIVELLRFNPELAVVTLGKRAAEGLDQIMPRAKFTRVPHPQFVKRFLHNKLDYVEMFRRAV
jgi:hypothetical protein